MQRTATDRSRGREDEVVVKLGDVMMIVDLHRKGLTVSAIARETGFDRETVRK